MTKISYLMLVLSIGALAACQRAEDPAKAGFVDGIWNLVDGTYDQRLEAKQQERRNLGAVNLSLSEQIEALRAQEASNVDRLAAAEDALDLTDRRIAALRARYAGAQEQYRGELATLEEVKAEVDQQRLILTAAKDDDADRDQLVEQSVQRVDELSRIIDLMPE